MPTASQRSTATRKGGSSTASNETPVSTPEQPNPPSGANTKASRPPKVATDKEVVSSTAAPRPADKANGRDHPTETEHDHAHQKLKGFTSTRE